MLKKIRSLFAPPAPPTGHFLGITTSQMQALHKLASVEEYEVFRSVLDLRLTLESEKLLAAGDAFSLARQQGVLLGLRAAGTLVDEVLQHEAHAANEQRSRQHRQQSAANRSASAAANSLYGTPAWSALK